MRNAYNGQCYGYLGEDDEDRLRDALGSRNRLDPGLVPVLFPLYSTGDLDCIPQGSQSCMHVRLEGGQRNAGTLVTLCSEVV
jgi:hypothetical protein